MMNMKLFNFITICAAGTLLFSSCSEDNELENVNEKIVGEWKATEILFEGTSSFENSEEINSTFNGTGYDLMLNIQFSSDSAEFISHGGYNIELESDTRGEIMITEWMNPGFIQTGSWMMDGERCIITTPKGEEQYATILSLNENQLILSYDFSYEVLKSEHVLIYQVHGTFTFEKQVQAVPEAI